MEFKLKEYYDILIFALLSHILVGRNFREKKGRRSALNSLSVNLVSLVNFEKYASKEEKCTSTDKDFKTSHDVTGIILM